MCVYVCAFKCTLYIVLMDIGLERNKLKVSLDDNVNRCG